MKFKELFYGLGLKPASREYSFDLDTFVLPSEGEITFARWRHPHERKKEISQRGIDALRKLLNPGDWALDIGAHTGDTSVPIALAVGPTGGVFAAEPNPYTYKILLVNSALNRKKANIIPLMYAATKEDADFEFSYSDPGFSNGGMDSNVGRWKQARFFKVPVKGRNILHYLQREYPSECEKIRYLKIDTEGFDREVVGTLKELLRKNRPYIRSEIYQHLTPEARRGYFSELRELGYRIHRFESLHTYAGEPLDSPEDLLRWKHFDIFAVPD